jgi:hypothetical protein
LPNLEKSYGERVLEAATKRWPHGIGLGEVLIMHARRNGYDAMSTRNPGPLLKAAFRQPDNRMLYAAGAVSTYDLSDTLSNVANKIIRNSFEAVESTWRQIAAIRSLSDFKESAIYSLTGDFTYKEIKPGGEIEHATAGETPYTNQLATHGRMFGIDRRDIINDDLSAFDSVSRLLGRGGALQLNLQFWTAFMNNASFFTALRGNYAEGAGTVLSIDSLTTAENLFLNQTDPDGNPMAVTPRFLLVPNALTVSASALMNSTEIRNTTASTTFGTINPHAGKYEVVRSSYLSNSSITGNSTTAWYLLSDPNEVPVIEVAFLNGVQTPTVERADADFNTLGIQLRGYFDFGVALQEYRGGVKIKGAS